MQVFSVSGVNFGYKSVLKRDFDKGLIPLKRDITGHKLKRGSATLDHTVPKSKGGKSNINNYTIMNGSINGKRGNKPLKPYIDLESLVEYIYVMLSVKTEDVDGVEYLKGWLRTLLFALKNNL